MAGAGGLVGRDGATIEAEQRRTGIRGGEPDHQVIDCTPDNACAASHIEDTRRPGAGQPPGSSREVVLEELRHQLRCHPPGGGSRVSTEKVSTATWSTTASTRCNAAAATARSACQRANPATSTWAASARRRRAPALLGSRAAATAGGYRREFGLDTPLVVSPAWS